jgi:hypothetical protein
MFDEPISVAPLKAPLFCEAAMRLTHDHGHLGLTGERVRPMVPSSENRNRQSNRGKRKPKDLREWRYPPVRSDYTLFAHLAKVNFWTMQPPHRRARVRKEKQ